MGVVEVDPTHVNFPSSHPLHIGYTQPSGVDPVLTDADVVLVVECDVPWYPALAKPAPDAAIIHLGVDPLFVRYPMRSFPATCPSSPSPRPPPSPHRGGATPRRAVGRGGPHGADSRAPSRAPR